MANDISKTPTTAPPQMIPLSKIHDLPGVFNPKPQDKTLGSMVLSIESSGIKEPIILRLQDNGEYQLLSGYRRRRASELAKKEDIPAYVYEMTTQEAITYRKAVKKNPDAPIPGKMVVPNSEKDKAKENATHNAPGDKSKEGTAPDAPGDKAKEGMAPDALDDKVKEGMAPDAPGDKVKEGTAPDIPDGKAKEGAAPDAPGGKAKEGTAPNASGDKAKEGAAPDVPGDKAKEGAAPDVPGDKAKEGTAPDIPGGKANEGAAPDVPGDKTKEGAAPDVPGDKSKVGASPDAPSGKSKEDTAPDAPSDKSKENATLNVPGDKAKEGAAPDVPGDKAKEGAAPDVPGDKAKEGAAPDVPGDKAKEGTAPDIPGGKAKENAAPDAPGDKVKEGAAPNGSDENAPTVAELEARAKSGQPISVIELAQADKREAQNGGATQQKNTDKNQTVAQDKGMGETMTAAKEGPSGTAITQIFEKRLDPPDEASRKSLPMPKEGESYFITLHPAYMEKSIFNNFSVDTESENFKELLKSVELVGIKDPVLARFNENGGLEILSGQRRHLAATILNQAVPTIIQKIDDADAKIMVADGNLHRDKISSYDLSRALRMKMEGMKQKAGRRKKGYSANELQSDAKLAQEMGMSVAKLNRLIRMSEAVKGVCDLVDDGKLTISVASEMSALKPKTQESVLYLLDLGYKATNERISRIKKAEGGGKKLDEMDLRNILDDKDIAPKQPEPQMQPEAHTEPVPDAGPETPSTAQPPIPASPDVSPSLANSQQDQMVESTAAPAPEQSAAQPPAGNGGSTEREKEDDPFRGAQERPEVTRVILTGDRLRKYFPDVSMTPREIEESVYSALEERRQRQMREQQKTAIFKKGGPSR